MDVTDRERVIALSGSQRNGSYTRRALEHVLTMAAETGATTELVDIREMDRPVFDPDEPDVGDAGPIRQQIRSADAVALGAELVDYAGIDSYPEINAACTVPTSQ